MNHVDVLHKLPVNQPASGLASKYSFSLAVDDYDSNEAGELACRLMHAAIDYHDTLALREFESLAHSSNALAHKKQLLMIGRSDLTKLITDARQSGKQLTVEAEIKLIVE